MKADFEMDSKLTPWFESLHRFPGRDPDLVAAGREQYLLAARAMAAGQIPLRPVQVRPMAFRNGQRVTLAVLLTVLMVSFLGGGAALAAAQFSLPGETLYGLKQWSETVRMVLTRDTEEAWQLSLAYTERRAGEIEDLAQRSESTPIAVLEALKSEIDRTMQLVLDLQKPLQNQALEQTRQRLELHKRILEQVAAEGPDDNLEAVLVLLQTRLMWLESGIEMPETLRQRLQTSQPGGQAPSPANTLPTASATPALSTQLPPTATDQGDPGSTGIGSPQHTQSYPSPTVMQSTSGAPRSTQAQPTPGHPGQNAPKPTTQDGSSGGTPR